MLDLHVLGTSSARPTKGRSVSGSYLSTQDGGLLVDCGEGMQERMMVHDRSLRAAGSMLRTRISRTRAILLTHGHLDHCWGVLPLLHTIDNDGRNEPLTIVGPSTSDAIEWAESNPGVSPPPEVDIAPGDLAVMFSWWQAHGGKKGAFRFPLEWILVPTDDQKARTVELPRLDSIVCTAVPTLHGVPSCAWHVATRQRPGRFNRELADSLSLDDAMISRLAGGEDVVLSDQRHRAADFRGEPRPGVSVLISGDTGAAVPAFADGSLPAPEALVHEATFLDVHADKALAYAHCTASDAAAHADSLGARTLFLTHYSSRLDSTAQSIEEAERTFSPTAALADGDIVSITSDGTVTHRLRTSDGWTDTEIAPAT